MNDYIILKDLVNFNTIKDKENTDIINYIEKYLQKYGFITEVKNKYLIMKTINAPKFGFLGHTDTVEYIDGWNSNPFELTQKDGNLYGLGTCDMKGGIAAFLEAISEIDFNKLTYGIKAYFTFDEEIGFGGINEILKRNENFPQFMIFGEPTNNKILVGSKGILEYKLIFNGIKAHSSTPQKGKSANMNAVKFLSELNDFYEKEIKVIEVKEYEIPYTTMNVGLINGGSAINSVSAKCEVSIDFRIANSEHINLIKNKINYLAVKYDCKVEYVDSINPFINDVDFVPNVKTANFITEASCVEGCKKMILGVGPVTAHEINEHITIESYKKLVKQYKDIIEYICKEEML